MVQAAFELVGPPTSSYVQRHWRVILLTLSAAAIASGWLLHGTSLLTVLRSSSEKGRAVDGMRLRSAVRGRTCKGVPLSRSAASSVFVFV